MSELFVAGSSNCASVARGRSDKIAAIDPYGRTRLGSWKRGARAHGDPRNNVPA